MSKFYVVKGGERIPVLTPKQKEEEKEKEREKLEETLKKYRLQSQLYWGRTVFNRPTQPSPKIDTSNIRFTDQETPVFDRTIEPRDQDISDIRFQTDTPQTAQTTEAISQDRLTTPAPQISRPTRESDGISIFDRKIEPRDQDISDIRFDTGTPQTAQTTQAIHDDPRAFFDPVPDRVRTRDFIREVPGAAHEIFQDAVRYSMSLGAGLVAQLEEPFRPIQIGVDPRESIKDELSRRFKALTETEYEPRYEGSDKWLEEFLIGKDQDPFSLASQGIDFARGVGMSEEAAKKYGPFIGLGLVATDWTPLPGGKGSRKGLQALVARLSKQTDVADIAKSLRRLNMPEDIISHYAPIIAKETDPAIVSKMFNRASELTLSTTPGARHMVDKLATTKYGKYSVTDNKTLEAIKKSTTGDPFKTVRESTIIKKQLDAYIKGAREGVYATKASIKKVQTDLTNIIATSGIEPSKMKNLLKTVKNIQTPEQLAKRLPEVVRQIDTTLTATTKKKLTDSIFKTIDEVSTKRIAGIDRGKIGAQAQTQIDEMKRYVNMKQSDADIQMAKILENTVNPENPTPITPEIARQMDLLRMAGVRGEKIGGKVVPSQKTVGELENTLSQLRHIIDTGRTKTELRKINYEAYVDRINYGGMNALTGGKGLKPTGLGIKGKKGIPKYLNQLDNWLHGMDTLLDKLSVLDPSNTGMMNGFLNRTFGDKINYARLKQSAGTRHWQEEAHKNLAKSFGIDPKKGRALRSLINKNKMETVELSMKVPQTGETITRKFSPNQIYKKWMELQDPTLRKTFTEGMLWNENDTIRQINKYMDANPKLKAWAKWQLDEFYPKFGKTVAPVFESRFNSPFVMAKNYSPIERAGYTVQNWEKSLLDQAYEMSYSLPGSLKKRVDNIIPLEFIDGDEVLMKHIIEMEHFKHFEGPIRDMRRFFGNNEIKTAIKQYHGDDILTTMNYLIDNIARDGMDMASAVVGLDRVRAGFSRAVLGLNPSIFLKQMMSQPAFITEMPGGALRGTKNWIKYTADFWTDPLKKGKILSQSEFMKGRHSNMERDIRLLMKRDAVPRALSGSESFLDQSLIFMRAGDKGAIYSGGWAVYKSNYDELIKRGLTHKQAHAQALTKFENAARRTQQAGQIETLSKLQTMGGSFGKLWTQFLTAPQQYYRIASRSARNLKYGVGDPATNIRNFVIAWAVLPMMFQWATDGFKFKKERQARAALAGPLIGIPILGSVVDNLARAFTGDDLFGASLPGPLQLVDKPFREAYKLFNKLRAEDANVEFEDVWNTIEALTFAFAKMRGVPLEQAVNRFQGIKDVLEGDDLRRAVWTEYALGTDGKNEPTLPSFKGSSPFDSSSSGSGFGDFGGGGRSFEDFSGGRGGTFGDW
jgi:hypothetical protein